MRILITRTDRMGDVILAIPAVRHLRKLFPDAYIAFMVAYENRELVQYEKDINRVIVYDKKKEHKGIWANFKFIREIRKDRFDLAIALHPSNRVHFFLFASGIPRRVGYNRKWAHFLTEKIPHKKQYGEKHEVDYNLELLEAAGFDISDADRQPRIFAGERASKEVSLKIRELEIKSGPIAIHPGASCRSKMWPLERFAEASDIIAWQYSSDIVIVGGGNCTKSASIISKSMARKPFDLTGELGLSELAALFSACRLVITNDSGPAHLAAALGIPVVIIFGRNDKGLSPERWAPVTERKRVLHSPPGCSPCLAHNCEIGFKCLDNITVNNVVEAARELLA